jgi:3-oxoacyl-[acyl-carrier-protein] synthase III
MFLVHSSYYSPEGILPNEAFMDLNGLSPDWIVERTGIHQRRIAQAGETTDTMALEAVKNGLKNLPFDYKEIDLIVSASYTPYDTVATMSHKIQHYLNIPDIPAVYISTACSSFLNAMEVVQGYFAMGKASKAIVVVSEHNSFYNDVHNTQSGHLWGDGAAAMFVSKSPTGDNCPHILDLFTRGAATMGKSIEAVNLVPHLGKTGISMENGRDVFIHACEYMAKSTTNILSNNGYSVDDLTYFIPHQANLRITKNVAQQLNIPEEKAVTNLDQMGNTGCAGCAIGLAQIHPKLKKDDIVVVTVFGGGYSYGAMLIKA